jgi:hypothetical protein
MFEAITLLRCACGEVHPSALTLRRGRFVCGNCREEKRGIRKARCKKCGRIGPIHGHHKHGHAVSDETVKWCVNCHQIYHQGQSVKEVESRGTRP